MLINSALIALVFSYPASSCPPNFPSYFSGTRSYPPAPPPLQGGQSQEQTDFYLSSPFCTFASFTFWRKLSFQFHYFCAHAGSDCSYCFWLSASLLFAVNIYVLFCDIISKYFLILLNPSGGAGRKSNAKSGWQSFGRLLLMKVIEFCISFNLFAPAFCSVSVLPVCVSVVH